MKDGQQIRFSGEGDQQPGLEAGDVVIVLDEKEHNVFKREGIDLSMTLQITLTEALCGFQRHIQTLDNRTLAIMSLPGTFLAHFAAFFHPCIFLRSPSCLYQVSPSVSSTCFSHKICLCPFFSIFSSPCKTLQAYHFL